MRGNATQPSSGPVSGQRNRRHMEYLPSISRSGGLEKDGNALKDAKTQEEYWLYIREKLTDYWTQFPLRSQESTRKSELESNLLILLRKLREGILSSRRTDEFSLIVYETSLYLAIIFRSPKQATATISHLYDLYLAQKPSKMTSVPAPAAVRPPTKTSTTSIISLLHHLNDSYPSQTVYFSHLATLPSSCLDRGSDIYTWLVTLRSSLLFHNYSKFEALTRPSVVLSLSICGTPEDEIHLEHEALSTLLETLRDKMRESAWLVVRRTYRELSLRPDNDTASWIGRTLMLPGSREYLDAEEWIQKKAKEGHVRSKDGYERQWTLCR